MRFTSQKLRLAALSSQAANYDFFRVFQRLDRRLASYGRKIVKKFVKSLPAFDVIQQRLKRNPRPPKNRSATQNLGIARDHAI
jgi:hypothetical protein